MARILALDTTSDSGGIALIENGVLVDEAPMHSTEGFGHVLFNHLRLLLDRRGLRAQDIDCFAGAAGPGSFTGVRIGLTAIKGLAEATGKPVLPKNVTSYPPTLPAVEG